MASETTPATLPDKYSYLAGFGNYLQSEALPGALPVAQNSPQVCAYGLYAEQLTGTAFTAPRAKNLRSWLYRIRPTVGHSPFSATDEHPTVKPTELVIDPNQFRWDPLPLYPAGSSGEAGVDFVRGLVLMAGAGEESMKEGLNVYHYRCNVSMGDSAFYNSDGSFLIVPDTGVLDIRTEFGCLQVQPCEIVVIPRGIRFNVAVSESSRGYICEILKGNYELPGLGPIGANGLANARDFELPVAAFEDRDVPFTIINKYQGKFFQCSQEHSPFDVVAWHGNYTPYKYDLRKFNTMNSVSYDHPDPSIYTVLTCPSDEPGTAVCDFVIFPPRWMVMEHSFRPPYYHRNTMTEYMGMIYGQYDAKKAGKGGFQPGGASLHSCMTSHGPDETAFLKASTAELTPQYFSGGLAFMFETCFMLKVNPAAVQIQEDVEGRPAAEVLYPPVQPKYPECWRRLPKIFNGSLNPPFPEPSK